MKDSLPKCFIELDYIEHTIQTNNKRANLLEDCNQYVKERFEDFSLTKKDEKMFLLCKILMGLVCFAFLLTTIFFAYQIVSFFINLNSGNTDGYGLFLIYYPLIGVLVYYFLSYFFKECKKGLEVYKAKKKDVIKYNFYKQFISYDDNNDIDDKIVIDKAYCDKKQLEINAILQEQARKKRAYTIFRLIYLISSAIFLFSLNYSCITIGDKQYSLSGFIFNMSSNNIIQSLQVWACADFPYMKWVFILGFLILAIQVGSMSARLVELMLTNINVYDKQYLFYTYINNSTKKYVDMCNTKNYGKKIWRLFLILLSFSICFVAFHLIPIRICYNIESDAVIALISNLSNVDFSKAFIIIAIGTVSNLISGVSLYMGEFSGYYILGFCLL